MKQKTVTYLLAAIAITLSWTTLYFAMRSNEPVSISNADTEIQSMEALKTTAFEAVDLKNPDGWDEKIDIDKLDETKNAAIGSWYAWDKWQWIGYKNSESNWKVLVSLDGFDCKEVDSIPAKYNVFFREVVYINKATKYCYEH